MFFHDSLSSTYRFERNDRYDTGYNTLKQYAQHLLQSPELPWAGQSPQWSGGSPPQATRQVCEGTHRHGRGPAAVQPLLEPHQSILS